MFLTYIVFFFFCRGDCYRHSPMHSLSVRVILFLALFFCYLYLLLDVLFCFFLLLNLIQKITHTPCYASQLIASLGRAWLHALLLFFFFFLFFLYSFFLFLFLLCTFLLLLTFFLFFLLFLSFLLTFSFFSPYFSFFSSYSHSLTLARSASSPPVVFI